MDHGPFFASNLQGPAPALKTLTLRLGDDPAAAVSFDTMTLRWNAAWTGGFLRLPRKRDGMEGTPVPWGRVQLTNAPGPAWDLDGSLADPRTGPHERLPDAWGRWRGVHLHGDQAILHYEAGGIGFLELNTFTRHGDRDVFTRSIQFLDPSGPRILRLLTVAGAEPVVENALESHLAVGPDEEVSVAIGDAPPGTRLVRDSDGHLLLHLPACRAGEAFRVHLSRGTIRSRADFHAVAPPTPARRRLLGLLPPSDAFDLRPLTRGGPGRWGAPLEAPGQLQTSGADDDAYVVDTLPVPEDNPYRSWIRLSGLDFFADATRAAVCSVSGDVWIVSGIDGDLRGVRWQRFATGLFQPLGLRIVDGQVHVLGRDQITRLHDLDGDGEADHYENFNNDVTITDHYHEFCLGLETDRAGNFYFNKGGNLGRARIPHQGTLLRVPSDGSRLEVVATGLRAPNGLGMGPGDEITTSDNEGNWVPASRVNRMRPGGFYGHVFTAHRTPSPTNSYDPPIFWLPKNVDNSSGGQVWVTSDRWGPLGGDMLHTSYGQSALFKVFQEEVDGVLQGGVWRFPLKFDSGIMRGRFNPRDGQLYVVGLVIWQSNGPRKGAFHRIRHTGKPVRLPRHLRVRPDGVELEFTSPLDPASVRDPDNWAVERWNYQWTEKYGSPEFSVADPTRKGRDPVPVEGVDLSADGTRVRLRLGVVEPVMQQRIKFRVRAADGTEVDQEVYHTIHRVPTGR